MYFNVFGEKVSKRRYKEMCEAAKNRRELIAAGLTSRRDLFKMGLLTAGGMLVAKSGLSARAFGQSMRPINLPAQGAIPARGRTRTAYPGNQTASPKTRAFVRLAGHAAGKNGFRVDPCAYRKPEHRRR